MRRCLNENRANHLADLTLAPGTSQAARHEKSRGNSRVIAATTKDPKRKKRETDRRLIVRHMQDRLINKAKRARGDEDHFLVMFK